MESHTDWSGDDLIDFEVGSPDLRQGRLTDALLEEERIAETLLDSELLRLEETLQTASSTPHCRSRCSSRDSVELEHILISIDDDYPESTRNAEISNALHELDMAIHDEIDGPDRLPNIEDCLRDLDDYLQGFESSGSEATDFEASGSDLEQIQQPVGVQGKLDSAGITDRLRLLASRSRSLRHGNANTGYEEEQNAKLKRIQRPLSADWKRNDRDDWDRPRNEELGTLMHKRHLKEDLNHVSKRNSHKRQLSEDVKHRLKTKQDVSHKRQLSEDGKQRSTKQQEVAHKRHLSEDWNEGSKRNTTEKDFCDDWKLRFKRSTLECQDWENVKPPSNWDEYHLMQSESEFPPEWGQIGCKRQFLVDWNHLKRNTIERGNSSNALDISKPTLQRPLSADCSTASPQRNQIESKQFLVDRYDLERNATEREVIEITKPTLQRLLSDDCSIASPEWNQLDSIDRSVISKPLQRPLSDGCSIASPEWNQIDFKQQFSVDGNDLERNAIDRTEVISKSLQRPVSADCSVAFGRKDRLRSTIGACGRSVPCVSAGSSNQVEYDTDEEIDWSWVKDVVHDATPEEACANGVSSSGTTEDHSITIDPPSVASSSTSAQTTRMEETAKSDDRGRGSSWLRSSMRRVRHFRLPSDPAISDVESVIATASSTPNVLVDIVPVVVNREMPRPLSAPIRTSSNSAVDRSRSRASEVSTAPGGRARSSSESSRSRRRARSLSSSESSLASSVDSSPSCTPASSPTHPTAPAPESTPTTAPRTRRPCEQSTGRESEMPESHSPLGQWPHSLSSMLACLGCTLGLFNVSRFAILTVRFGANFILQFLVLSFIFGIPLFTLQLCLGQQLGAGVVDMWRISPLFQGVGIALLVAQALIGLYSIVGISWMFIYFRDSFITKQDQYRWAEPYEYYREESRQAMNNSLKLTETVPDYFSGVVLQRHNLVTGNSFGGAIKFQVAFNLAVVWMIVFVSLSKGLRSYAKVVYVFTLLPIFGTFILCAKLLGMAPNESLHEVFPETSWGEFFLNSRSWIAASQEAFLTWGLLGASVMQIASHNKHKHLLQRDSSLVIILTITILMLTAFLANTCIEILHFYGYNYMPNSFEKISTYLFLRPTKDPLPPSLSSTPIRYMTHSSYILGEKVIRPGMDRTMESGYQVLRFATELVPATLAILGPTQISPFWAVLFYFILILFGIAQQLAIWHCVITGIMAFKAKVLKSWETTITFFTCTFGFILGLPMTTELGIYVVYFLDYVVGGAWWLVLVYLIQIVAVFMVRGRPYSGDTVVTALFTSSSSSCVQTWLAPLLSFTWNVILPVALMVVCITQFKSGNFKELFVWHHAPSLEYWPTWTRQIGSLLQLMPILCIPVVAIVQSYRYLNNGPPDILDRIQLLYRPPMNSEHLDDLAAQTAAAATAPTNPPTTNPPAEDPPPKYTPPPSYTTATGARIAKMLRQSIRRSVRRLANVLGESSTPRVVERPPLQVPPPDYSTVLVEMNQTQVDTVDARYSTSERMSQELSNLPQGSPLTAADVASILRSSFRRSTLRSAANRVRRSAPEEVPSGSLSVECLVDGIAPLGEDSLVLETIATQTKGPTDN